ncbi:MAG: hypothetical protein WDN06_15255 [Asticcacaulis sp.]
MLTDEERQRCGQGRLVTAAPGTGHPYGAPDGLPHTAHGGQSGAFLYTSACARDRPVALAVASEARCHARRQDRPDFRLPDA